MNTSLWYDKSEQWLPAIGRSWKALARKPCKGSGNVLCCDQGVHYMETCVCQTHLTPCFNSVHFNMCKSTPVELVPFRKILKAE